jgi:hypothetical protein
LAVLGREKLGGPGDDLWLPMSLDSTRAKT